MTNEFQHYSIHYSMLHKEYIIWTKEARFTSQNQISWTFCNTSDYAFLLQSFLDYYAFDTELK